jgi:predicted nucleotidyltransferase
MKKSEGLSIARKYKDAVCKRGYPVERVYLFGSVVRNEATEDSDIDVAVVCTAFMPSRMDETLALWKARRQVDIRIEPLCLHPEDFANPLSIAREIERTGVEV